VAEALCPYPSGGVGVYFESNPCCNRQLASELFRHVATALGIHCHELPNETEEDKQAIDALFGLHSSTADDPDAVEVLVKQPRNPLVFITRFTGIGDKTLTLRYENLQNTAQDLTSRVN